MGGILSDINGTTGTARILVAGEFCSPGSILIYLSNYPSRRLDPNK